MATTAEQKIAKLARRSGVIRPRDLSELGVPRKHLSRLVTAGILERVGRGLYVLAGSDVGEHHSFAEAAKCLPDAVVCLLSALAFHDITTQSPHEIWIALDMKAWKPTNGYPPLRVVRFTGAALTEGVEEHDVEGVPVKVYSPAKTVADCFKYRNKIGKDIALEALRDSWRKGRATMDDLWKYAKVCRVANVMRPYLESLTIGE